MQQTERTDAGRSRNAAISDAVVATIRRHAGRGPTEIRTTVDRNVVVVVMRDAMSKAETRLAQSGVEGEAQALGMRVAFQGAMRADLVADVERLTGRKVEAFMSMNHADPDYGVEVFICEDAVGDGAGAAPPGAV